MTKQQQLQALERSLHNIKKIQVFSKLKTPLGKADLNVLFCLRFCKPNQLMKMSDIATTLQVTLPAITHRIDALVLEGYVEKKPNQKDQRITNIVLTEKAIFLVDSMKDSYFLPLAKIVEKLGSEDTENLIRILNKLS